MEFFGSDSDEEDTLDNHAIDQLLAACMRLVPPLAGLRPALRLGDNSRCFADRAAAAGFDVVTGACDVLLVDENGKDRLYEGKHTILFSRGHGEEFRFEVVVALRGGEEFCRVEQIFMKQNAHVAEQNVPAKSIGLKDALLPRSFSTCEDCW